MQSNQEKDSLLCHILLFFLCGNKLCEYMHILGKEYL